jgi:hypothetical protein
MKMRSGIRIGFALAMAVLMIAGCCNNPPQYHYPISSTILGLTPYNAGSIFHLRHSAGPIVRMEVISENRSDYKVNPCGNCCTEEYRDQYVIYFQSDSAALQFQVQISQEGQEGTYAPARLELNLGATGVFYADFQADGACRQQASMTCRDTMQVADRVYYNVFELQNQSSNQADATPDRLYYCPSDGLIKFSTYGGAYWELVR